MAKLTMTIEVTDELDIKGLTDPHEVAEDLVSAYQDVADHNPDGFSEVTFVSAEWVA
jgi:hypothetical protein